MFGGVNLWFSYGFPRVVLWFSYGKPPEPSPKHRKHGRWLVILEARITLEAGPGTLGIPWGDVKDEKSGGQ